jgi:hypothetical protein
MGDVWGREDGLRAWSSRSRQGGSGRGRVCGVGRAGGRWGVGRAGGRWGGIVEGTLAMAGRGGAAGIDGGQIVNGGRGHDVGGGAGVGGSGGEAAEVQAVRGVAVCPGCGWRRRVLGGWGEGGMVLDWRMGASIVLRAIQPMMRTDGHGRMGRILKFGCGMRSNRSSTSTVPAESNT